jgi:hypothetical protein
MAEGEEGGMQHQARRLFEPGGRRIQIVAEDRVTDGLQVNPQLESRGTLRDGTDPASFEYTINARRRVEL